MMRLLSERQEAVLTKYRSYTDYRQGDGRTDKIPTSIGQPR